MKRIVIAAALASLTAIACGPGREAAWEREGAAGLKADGGEPAATAESDLKSEAEAAWEKRGERAELERALANYEKIVAAGDADAEAWTALARCYYLLADGYIRFDDNEELMLATYEKGVLAGERAMMAASPEFEKRVKAGEKVEEAVGAVPPAGQAAIYWYATNLGRFAVAKGFTTVLFYKDRIYNVMERVLEIDETFFHGAPHRYFGAFFAKAPAFAGGDMDKSKEHFEKALKITDKYLGTKVLYAEYYAAKAEDKELFTRLLNEVKAADPATLPDVLPEQKIEQAKAEALLAQVDDLF